jgi:hypothetical protein
VLRGRPPRRRRRRRSRPPSRLDPRRELEPGRPELRFGRNHPLPGPTPSPATVTEPNPDELRAAFIGLAAHDRGHDGVLPPDTLPSLAQQVCTTVAAGRNADAVWQAAGNLEQQDGLPTAAAWDLIDLAATAYCPDLHMLVLVLTTTVAMGD